MAREIVVKNFYSQIKYKEAGFKVNNFPYKIERFQKSNIFLKSRIHK